MRIPILSTTLFVCITSFVSASLPAQTQTSVVQTVPLTLAKAADRYAGESVVVERSDQLYVMNADGTGYREQAMVIRVQSEAAVRQLGILGISFAGASERVEIQYARIRRPDGTVIETNVSDALEQPETVTREAPFYSDLKQKQLPIKSLRAGDKLEWKARVVRTKAEAPGHFWGQNTFVSEGVALSENLELRVPKDTAVTVWTNPKLNLKPIEKTEADQHVYRWESSSMKPTAGPEADAEKKKKEKELWTAEQELEAKEGLLPSVAWTTFKSWESVGSWYRSLEADRMVPDAAVKTKVAELTAGKTTQEEKVRAVYAFVSTQVRYIGVAFGVGRYQPHHADEVMDNQYGDCKDKHTLLAAMLNALGLHPDAVLIGAGIRFNEAVPSPAAFNHLITRVDLDGKETWLDTTAEVAPYRMLTVTIRDKQALVVPESGVPFIKRTVADPPFASYQTMKAVGSLDTEGISNSRLTFTLRGDDELYIREVLHQTAPAQFDEFTQRLSQGIGYSGTTSHSEITRPEDTADPLTISYDYKREKAGDWSNYKIIAQLLPVTMPMVDEKTPPVQSIDLGIPRTMSSTAEMKIPTGWGVELPEAVHQKAAFATYDMTFRFDKGTLYSERKVVVLQQKIAANDWKTYKKWQDAVELGNEPFIQLTRTGGKGPASGSKASESGPPAPTVSNAEAAKLIREAFDALQKMDLDKASPLLDQARKLSPQEKMLWAAYGYMSELRGAELEAAADYKKELSYHPDSSSVYRSLVYSQIKARKRSDAMETLRTWIAADAGDPVPAMQLSAMQLEDHDAAAAYQTMNAAISKMPEDKRNDGRVKLALCNAEIKNGMEAKASASLVELLKTTEDAGLLNDAAYALSETGHELPAAEIAQYKALSKMDAETQSWTLDESPQVLKQKSSLLVASWDTMGWILFHEGKLEEARSYVRAAWLNGGHAVVGEHLGDIEMAMGEPTSAVQTFEMAKKAGGPVSELDERKNKAKKAGGKSTSTDAEKELKELRTVKLGPANGNYGAAEYRMLLSKGHVERVEPTGEKTVPGALEVLGKMQVAQMFPKDSEAKLVKSGILNCYAGNCELIFEQ